MSDEFKDPASDWLGELNERENAFFSVISLRSHETPLVETFKMQHQVFWVRGNDFWNQNLNKTLNKLNSLDFHVETFGETAKDPYIRLIQVQETRSLLKDIREKIQIKNQTDGVEITLLSEYGIKWCNELFESLKLDLV